MLTPHFEKTIPWQQTLCDGVKHQMRCSEINWIQLKLKKDKEKFNKRYKWPTDPDMNPIECCRDNIYNLETRILALLVPSFWHKNVSISALSLDRCRLWTLTSPATLPSVSRPSCRRWTKVQCAHSKRKRRHVRLAARSLMLASSKDKFLRIIATCNTRWPSTSPMPTHVPGGREECRRPSSLIQLKKLHNACLVWSNARLQHTTNQSETTLHWASSPHQRT